MQIGDIICSEGDELILTRRAELDGYGFHGDLAQIERIIRGQENGHTIIGVVKKESYPAWKYGNLLRFSINDLQRYFEIKPQTKEMCVFSKFIYKGKI